MKRALFVVLLVVSLAALAAAQTSPQVSSVKLGTRTVTLQAPSVSAPQQLASAAFTFRTEIGLEIQGLVVPKGEYTLFVVPDPKEWQLVISSQKGATTRNRKMDVGEVPMDMKKAAAPAATLKATLTSYGKAAGTLDLTLGNTVASVPFNVDASQTGVEW